MAHKLFKRATAGDIDHRSCVHWGLVGDRAKGAQQVNLLGNTATTDTRNVVRASIVAAAKKGKA